MSAESRPSSAGKEAGPAPASPKPGHPRVVVALLLVATLLSVVGIFSAWINRQALNTSNWTSTSSRILEDKKVQRELREASVALREAAEGLRGKKKRKSRRGRLLIVALVGSGWVIIVPQVWITALLLGALSGAVSALVADYLKLRLPL